MSDEANITPPRRRLPTTVFYAVIFVPTLVTAIIAQLGLDELSLGAAIGGGVLSGLIGGPLLSMRWNKSATQRVALSIVLMIVLSMACVAMNCAGCIASSNFRVFH